MSKFKNMKSWLKQAPKDESGLTALETAIILIAFIVVASVFAFTILSAGTFSTERGKEAVYSGLQGVQSSMEVKGGVIAYATAAGTTGDVARLVFTVGNVVGGEPVDLNDGATTRVLVINYRDATQFVNDLDWTLAWIVRNDTDDLLDSGELAEITVPLTPTTVLNATGLGINTEFTLEMKPPKGSTIPIQRTTPPYMDLVMDFQ
ncbi:MAG: hypothetical protein AB1791_03050 [Chloroflexota bacterium]